MRWFAVFLFSLICSSPARASACWDEAGREHRVNPALLYAIAQVESNLNPAAKNTSHIARTNSYGIGLMQIESVHLPRLRRENIDEKRLLTDQCTNIKVGAGILADNFRRHGVTWEAVGAYNASCTKLKGAACRHARATYAWKVYRRLHGTAPRASRARPGKVVPATPAPAVFIQERLS